MTNKVFSLQEMQGFLEILKKHETLITQLSKLSLGEITLICSFLQGQLAAQVPFTTEAYIDGFNFFRELTERMIDQLAATSATADDELIFFAVSDFGNFEDVAGVLLTTESA